MRYTAWMVVVVFALTSCVGGKLTPPTPDKGFGSTVYNGMQIATLIQKYSRQ